MSSPVNEKGASAAPQLAVTTNTSPVAEPEKAVTTTTSTAVPHFDGASLHTTSSLTKPSHESLRHDARSGVSTPRSYTVGNPFDTDIEAIIPTSSSQEHCVTGTHSNGSSNACGRKSTTTRGDCQVWPGQDHWKSKAKAAKINNRSCTCMARLSKRTRLVVKILIILLIVGIAVGVGFGVSKPLGAPIWGKPADQN